MNKPPIRQMSPSELREYREQLWRAKPNKVNLSTLGRIDRRIEEMKNDEQRKNGPDLPRA